MPDPLDPMRDDSPTTPVDLPPLPPAGPAADAVPPAPVGAPWDTPGPTPWDAPGPIPPAGAPWAAGSSTPPAPAGPGPAGPAPAGPAPAGPAGPAYPGPAGPAPAGPGPSPRPSWAAGARPPAGPQAQPGLVAGIVLVVIGVVFLLIRVVDISIGAGSWPLWIMVPGLAMLAGSLAIPPRGGLGLAVPGTIIAVVGGILWVQDYYGLYATWAYAWALVAPTAPGLAMLVYGLVRGDRELAGDGFRTFLVGIGLFLGFGFFFEGVVGISGHRLANLDEVLPFVAIGFGVLLVVASLFGGGRRERTRA